MQWNATPDLLPLRVLILAPCWLPALPRAPSAAWAFGLHSLRRPSKHAQKGQSASASCTHSALDSATRRICRKAWARPSHAQASPATACTSDCCRPRPCISLAAGSRLKGPGWKSQAEAARPHNKMKTSDTLSKNADPQPVPERRGQGATARRLIGNTPRINFTNWGEHEGNHHHHRHHLWNAMGIHFETTWGHLQNPRGPLQNVFVNSGRVLQESRENLLQALGQSKRISSER